MVIRVQLTETTLETPPLGAEVATGQAGAWVDFRGLVRGEEAGEPIAALEYEAYASMAIAQMERLLRELGAKHRCLAAGVAHRTGTVPVGEAAIHVQVVAKHRAEAFALLAEFMDRLKVEVPIWKIKAVPANHALATPAS